jgi:hypothetical protein
MAAGSEYLSANFVNTRDFTPETIESLQGIENQVVRLRADGPAGTGQGFEAFGTI